MDLLADLLGGEIPMAKGRTRADANQACDLGDVQPRTTVEQEVAGNPRGGVVPLALLKELECGIKDGPLLIVQPLRRNPRPTQPLLKPMTFRSHAAASMTHVPHRGTVSWDNAKRMPNP
jgi:hypothetical protein